LHLENSISLPYSTGSLASIPMHTRLQKYQVNDNLDRQIGGNAIDKKTMRIYSISIDEGKELLIVDQGFKTIKKIRFFIHNLKA
jgi:hypothetical protein